MSHTRSRVLLLVLVVGIVAVAGLVAAVKMREQPAPAQGQAPAAPATPASVAVIDGQVITMADLEAALGTSLSKLEQDLYNLKRERLDAMVSERLLNAEAAKRGVDVKQLVATEITARITPVTDAEVDSFYETNKARLPNAPDIKAQIKQYLENQRAQARGQQFVEELRKSAKVEITLPEPPVRRATVDIGGAPIRGDQAAPVTIVEFSDFHCPFCKRVQPTLMEVLSRYPGKVRLVYMDLPLDSLHPQARRASEAARCAGDQGKFWEYHDKLYEGGPDVSADYLRKLASDIALDVAGFEQCLESGKHRAGIQNHVEQATRLGLSGTPAFFVNGRPVSGALPIESFVELVEAELKGH